MFVYDCQYIVNLKCVEIDETLWHNVLWHVNVTELHKVWLSIHSLKAHYKHSAPNGHANMSISNKAGGQR